MDDRIQTVCVFDAPGLAFLVAPGTPGWECLNLPLHTWVVLAGCTLQLV